ncbi:ANTAR domain-containing protein [Pseudokineococcus marinus]|uniref:ANTAR domain-containing protein n=1 Tax=Pseudokineococcus marinus TaxID=351215 RepID=A0A849BK30_9ACTN|nr:ANTAR domain-containing protein [Pseudokineococcus marinus]NNH23629.1 ANTAR domain-containing protein [Pseudokineococcus marinus]
MTIHLIDPCAGTAGAPPTTVGGRVHGASADLGAHLSALARTSTGQPLGRYARRVADLAARVAPGTAGVTVQLVEDGRLAAAASTSAEAAALDERQFEPGWGPALEASASGRVLCADLDDPAPGALDHHPALLRTARRQGLRSLAVLGLRVEDRPVGTITLCGRDGGLLRDGRIPRSRAFAAHAAVGLEGALLHAAAVRLVEQLHEAMRSRAVIEQAKGVLMVVHEVDADEAFALLATESQRTNTKLRVVAAGLVARAQGRAGAAAVVR